MSLATCSCAQRLSELREARDLIVQLQRELERARCVIAQQRAEIVSAHRGGAR